MPDSEHDDPTRDDTIDRLRAARPEIAETAHSAADPDAQALLASIVRERPTATPPMHAPAVARRRRPLLVAAVASAAAIAIGVGVVATAGNAGHTPNTPTAASTTEQPVVLANIRTIAASSNSALGGTGRAEITFNTDGLDSGTTDLAFAGHDVDMTIHFADDGAGRTAFDARNRTVDGQFYLYTPGPDNVARWYHDTNQASTSVFDTDPRTLLGALAPEAQFVTVGTGTVDGVDVTHLRATDLSALPALDLSLGPIDAHDISALDLWVGADNVVRRLDLTQVQKTQEIDPKVAPELSKHADGSITITDKDGHTQTVARGENLQAVMDQFPQVTKTSTSNYSVRFFDIGAPITISAPPDAVDYAGKG
jgi:hypothetical protein